MNKVKLIKNVVSFLVKNGYKHRKLIVKGVTFAIPFVKNYKKKKADNKTTSNGVVSEILESTSELKSSLTPTEQKELKQLQDDYLRGTESNKMKSEMYAAFGAAGVSPASLEKFEQSMKIIEEFKKSRNEG